MVISFLDRPGISYCKSGRKDTIYCGKDADGENVFQSCRYLLWTFKEFVVMFNANFLSQDSR